MPPIPAAFVESGIFLGFGKDRLVFAFLSRKITCRRGALIQEKRGILYSMRPARAPPPPTCYQFEANQSCVARRGGCLCPWKRNTCDTEKLETRTNQFVNDREATVGLATGRDSNRKPRNRAPPSPVRCARGVPYMYAQNVRRRQAGIM